MPSQTGESQDGRAMETRQSRRQSRHVFSEIDIQSQQPTKQSNNELKYTLKMRLVKGEISKEEYLEILKKIEL